MLSMLDRLWRPDLTEAEALELHEKGIAEVGSCCYRSAQHRLIPLQGLQEVDSQHDTQPSYMIVMQVKKRLVVAPSSFSIQIVDKNGIRKVKTIRGDLPDSS